MNFNDAIVRDRFWLWGHQEGSHGQDYVLPATSRMTPAEAAHYMGIPNLMMVGYAGQPEPPFDQYAKSLTSLKRVSWSVVGDGSSTRNDHQTDLEEVIALAQKFPNVMGGVLDDFFHGVDETGKFSRYDLAALRHMRDRLHTASPPLELSVVLYDKDLDTPLQEYLEEVDLITFWTWTADQLSNLETNMERLESLIGDKPKMLGCYLFDYGAGKEMPIEMMRYQCELGLKWLEEGRITGMVFLASCICDLELEAVTWARQWIAEVGDRALAPPLELVQPL